MRGLKWVQAGNSLDLASLGAVPVEGGYENDRTRLYIARAFHKNAKHPGKVSEKLDGGSIGLIVQCLAQFQYRCLYTLRWRREVCQGTFSYLKRPHSMLSCSIGI
jgi:hypothetical protein